MKELFEILPLENAMSALLPGARNDLGYGAAEKAARDAPTELLAAIWLNVDDLDRSHTISQGISGPFGAYWHGIMHRREGDFWNSKYWLRQACEIDLHIAGYEPSQFVDRVEAAAGVNLEELVDMQRKEWMALFTYCAECAGVKI